MRPFIDGVGAVVAAAGLSSRMGAFKPLLPIGSQAALAADGGQSVLFWYPADRGRGRQAGGRCRSAARAAGDHGGCAMHILPKVRCCNRCSWG